MLRLESWRCAELCWETAGDVAGAQPQPHIIPICDVGKSGSGQTLASASWWTQGTLKKVPCCVGGSPQHQLTY